MLIRLVCTFVLLLVSTTPDLAAQREPVTLEPGDTVRVVAPSLAQRRVEGRLVSYRADTVTVAEAGTGTTYAFPVTGVRSLAKNEGRSRSRSTWRTARFGAFLGVAAGLVGGPFIAQQGGGDHFGASVAVSGAGGAVLGTALGAAVGALFPRDQWQRIRVPRPAAVLSRGGASG